VNTLVGGMGIETQAHPEICAVGPGHRSDVGGSATAAILSASAADQGVVSGEMVEVVMVIGATDVMIGIRIITAGTAETINGIILTARASEHMDLRRWVCGMAGGRSRCTFERLTDVLLFTDLGAHEGAEIYTVLSGWIEVAR